MGMFDTIEINVKCPFCGEVKKRECQTKDLDQNLMYYKKGDYVDDKFNYVNCITDCQSKKCATKEVFSTGFIKRAKNFYLVVYLEKGKVSGKYKVIKE